jgi:MFS family permease
MLGAQAAFFAELFPPQRRFTGFALAREIGGMISGGPTPFIAGALLAWSGGAWWPIACYAMLLAGLTVIAVGLGPETRQEDVAETAEPADGAITDDARGSLALVPDTAEGRPRTL